MLQRIKSAWRRYLDSLPTPQEDLPDPEAAADGGVDDFPPHDAATLDAFRQLAEAITAHLPADTRARARQRLRAKLKPEAAPAEALAQWFQQVSDPAGPKLGTICLDWKATEEIQWQATGLLASHGLALAWDCGEREEAGEAEAAKVAPALAQGDLPVDAPLDRFARALAGQGYALVRFGADDAVYAFAVRSQAADRVRGLMAALGITPR